MLSYHRLRKAQHWAEVPSPKSPGMEAWSSWAPSIKAAAGFSSSAALAARSSALEARIPLRLTQILAGHQGKTTGDLHQLVAATEKWLDSGNT